MRRVLGSVCVCLIVVIACASTAYSFFPAPQSGGCQPKQYCKTLMVPCVESKLVADVRPVQVSVPVKRIGYTYKKFLVKGCPVGQPCGTGPCVKCISPPICKVVCKPVPYVYYTKVPYTCYQACYRRVCRQVLRPQVYKMTEKPLCY